MQTPYFSVLIPTYNCLEGLRLTIASVLAQSFEDYELIIVDDGSTDGTGDYCKQLSDPRIRYYYRENSGLPAIGRNTGLQFLKGRYTAFLDHDDLWKPTKLGQVHRALQQYPQAIAVSHDEQVLLNEEPGRRLHNFRKSDLPLYLELLINGNFISTSAFVIRTDLLQESGGFRTERNLVTVEDYELWLRLAREGDFVHVPEVLGMYRVDGSGLSTNVTRLYRNLKNVIDLHIENVREYGLQPARVYRQIDRRMRRDMALDYLRQGLRGKSLLTLLGSVCRYAKPADCKLALQILIGRAVV